MGFSALKAWFTKRAPNSQQIAAVYGVIVLVVYGWTIYWFLWTLPSWLYFLTLGEITVTFAYTMATNFFESILILLIPVFLSLLLPPRLFRDRFVAHGVSLSLFILIGLMQYLVVIVSGKEVPFGMGRMALLVIVGILLLTFIVGRIGFLCKVFEEIASRASIFVYVFLPISAISILLVLIRNLIEAFHG
jgi:hypothetical protein